MKRSGLWLGLLLASLAPVSAQVTVEVLQEQEQFLSGESLPVAVRVTNHSGQPLRLGAEDDWLTFIVEAREGQVVPKLADVPVTGEFTLESSKMATKRLNLAPYFSLARPGRYSVTAIVKIKGWDRLLNSAPKSFDIIQGAKLCELEFGVPRAAGETNGTPEVRKYILQQANYIKGQLRLYLRVTDAAGLRTFKVFPVGPMISFSRPETQVDQLSRLHLLYQNGPFSFSYTSYSPDGDLLKRETYDYMDKRPRLQVDIDGEISVAGGLRRTTPNDVPLPPPALSTTNAPSGTNEAAAPAKP